MPESTTHADIPSPASTEQARAEQELAERRRRNKDHETLPLATLGNIAIGAGTSVILLPRLPTMAVAIWFTLRLMTSIVRLAHVRRYVLHGGPEKTHKRVYRVGVFFEALLWSSLGWALTPVHNLEIAVVTIGVQLSVVALGGAMMYNDMLAARIFLFTILVPNAFYALQRHDDLGWFCCVSFIAAFFMFLGEAQRTNRRITELQQLREQANETVNAQAKALREAQSLNEMKSRFVATMSHEMRTPVHGILGLLRMARARVHDGEALRQLDLIRNVGDHLASVINQVLDFSKMEADTLPIHERPFDLPALAREVADTWSVTCQDKGLALRLELDLPSQARVVMGDPMRIRQVLYNLIGNAVKFTSRGTVTLRIGRGAQDPMIDFSVRDSGIGIPAGEMGKIFQPFQQAEGTYQRQFGGTGLGLTISRQLCVAMGGDLVCQSQVSKGSVFTFSLPLPASLAGAQASNGDAASPNLILGRDEGQDTCDDLAQPAIQHADGRTPHVLLVEDNPVNVIIAEAELRRLGVEVTTRVNGLEAIEWLTDNTADVVLMDCDMPEMDGIEATRRIREQERLTGREAIAIVALTAHGPEVYAESRRKAGMDDHITKPFTSEALRAVLARHLDKAVAEPA